MSKEGKRLLNSARAAVKASKIMARLGLVDAPGHQVAIVTKKGKLIARVHGQRLP